MKTTSGNPVKYEKTRELDAISGTRETMEAARYLRMMVALSSALLTLVFGWLKFRGVDVVGVVTTIPSSFILKLAMAIYFASWIAGLVSDISDLEYVFVKAPRPIHVKIGGTALGSLVVMNFATLCYVETMTTFSLVLFSLVFVNVCGWLYLTRIALPAADTSSRKYYSQMKKLFALECLNIVYIKYQRGNWQILRFALGFLLSGIIIAFAFQNQLFAAKIAAVQRYGDLLSAMLFLVYVLLFEGWIWFMRMRTKGGLALLSALESSYDLQRRAG